MKTAEITEAIAKTIELKDDATEFGGKSHSRETLYEFMTETGIDFNTNIETINKALTECGIEPISDDDIPAAI